MQLLNSILGEKPCLPLLFIEQSPTSIFLMSYLSTCKRPNQTLWSPLQKDYSPAFHFLCVMFLANKQHNTWSQHIPMPEHNKIILLRLLVVDIIFLSSTAYDICKDKTTSSKHSDVYLRSYGCGCFVWTMAYHWSHFAKEFQQSSIVKRDSSCPLGEYTYSSGNALDCRSTGCSIETTLVSEPVSGVSHTD